MHVLSVEKSSHYSQSNIIIDVNLKHILNIYKHTKHIIVIRACIIYHIQNSISSDCIARIFSSASHIGSFLTKIKLSHI